MIDKDKLAEAYGHLRGTPLYQRAKVSKHAHLLFIKSGSVRLFRFYRPKINAPLSGTKNRVQKALYPPLITR